MEGGHPMSVSAVATGLIFIITPTQPAAAGWAKLFRPARRDLWVV
jgi:hypothetical protein